MVDLCENLVQKAHFTLKTTGPAGQSWQMESALNVNIHWGNSTDAAAIWVVTRVSYKRL